MQPNPTPKVNCRYGAPLGRRGSLATVEPEGKVSLQRVRLDNGGYDAGGAYWGHGAPLYCAMDEGGAFTSYFRAHSREAAKDQLRNDYPDAQFSFYR